MNYFGMFFTYMLPGILIGVVAVTVAREEGQKRRRRAQRVQREQTLAKHRLYVHDLSKEGFKATA